MESNIFLLLLYNTINKILVYLWIRFRLIGSLLLLIIKKGIRFKFGAFLEAVSPILSLDHIHTIPLIELSIGKVRSKLG